MRERNFTSAEPVDLSAYQFTKEAEIVLSRTYTEPTVKPLPTMVVTDKREIRLYKVTGFKPHSGEDPSRSD